MSENIELLSVEGNRRRAKRLTGGLHVAGQPWHQAGDGGGGGRGVGLSHCRAESTSRVCSVHSPLKKEHKQEGGRDSTQRRQRELPANDTLAAVVAVHSFILEVKLGRGPRLQSCPARLPAAKAPIERTWANILPVGHNGL